MADIMMGDINLLHKTSEKNEAEFSIILSH